MDDYWSTFLLGAFVGAQAMAAFVLVLMYRHGMLSATDKDWM